MSALATHLNAGPVECPRCHTLVPCVATVKSRDPFGMPEIDQICRGKCGCGAWIEFDLIPNGLKTKS